MSRLLHEFRTRLGHVIGPLRNSKQQLSTSTAARASITRTVSSVPGRTGLGAFALGVGSSAAAFAAVLYRNDLFTTRPNVDAVERPAGDYAAVLELRTVLPPDVVVTDRGSLRLAGCSEYVAAVRVRGTEDVVKVVDIARNYGVPLITTYSSDYSLLENSPPATGILLDLSKMNKILHVHEDDFDLVCQPSASLEDVNKLLNETGVPLRLPVDARHDTALGTLIGAGAIGSAAQAGCLLNVTVVLPNGKVIKTQRRASKPGSGLDTTRLFVGTEGTLGIITEVTLRLAPILPTRYAVVQFDDISSAISAAVDLASMSDRARTDQAGNVQVLDDNMMNRSLPDGALPARNSVLVKFTGSEAAIRQDMTAVNKTLKRYKDTHPTLTLVESDVAEMLSKSPMSSHSLMRETSVSVPISHLPQLLQEAKEHFAEMSFASAFSADVKTGRLRAVMYYNGDDDVREVNDAVTGLVHRALALDGTCTAENGVGPNTGDYLVEELGPYTVEVMRTIKTAVDPQNILNPYKSY